MNEIGVLVAAAEKVVDAVKKAKEAYSAVMDSDGEQMMQALETLVDGGTADEMLR